MHAGSDEVGAEVVVESMEVMRYSRVWIGTERGVEMSDYSELKGLLEYVVALMKDKNVKPDIEKFDRLTVLTTPWKILDLLNEMDQIKAELECARGDLKTAVEIAERNQKNADRYVWLMQRGFQRRILGQSASIAPGRGPYVCVDLPSCGAPSSAALSFSPSADEFIDAAIQQDSQ